jgi:hypothetical protein
MMENGMQRNRRQLSPEEKWEIFWRSPRRSSRSQTRLESGTSM